MDIEVIGTSAVKEAIAMTDYLSPYVNEKDKEPLWDGNIYAYSQVSKKNDYIIGRAPVQVKGKESNDLTKQKINYSISVVNLEKYRLDGGIIYFVVLINERCEKKIYYNSLLPYVINKYLKNYKKKNKAIPLYELPMKKNEISNIVINFIKDRDKQVLLRNGKDISIKDFFKHTDKKNFKYGFTYTGLGYNREKPYEYLFNHDVYMYATNEELNITIPIDHMWRAHFTTCDIEDEVKIGDTIFYESYHVVHKADSEELHIGKSLRIILNEGFSEIKYHLKGSLNERIVTLRFMLALISEKKVSINGLAIGVKPTIKDIKSLQLDLMNDLVGDLCDLQEVFNNLGIREDLDCDNLSTKDEEYIRMLLLAFKHNQRISFNESEIPPIGTIVVGNLCIMIYFNKREDGKYKLENYIDCHMAFQSEYTDGVRFDTSIYTVLTKVYFDTVSNLCYEEIIKDVKKYDNKGNFIRANNMFLEMLKSYDCKKNELLLNAATEIASWLLLKDDIYDLTLLNVYQCYFRERKLEKEEENNLLQLIDNNRDNNAIIVAAYILLKEGKMAERYYNKMSVKEQETFKTFPIYTLLNNEIFVKCE